MRHDLGITPYDIFRLTQAACDLAEKQACGVSDVIDRLEMNGDELQPISDPIHFARTARRFRLSRERRLGAPLFRDPAWDMLLDLLISEADGRNVSITSLCQGAGVPATTALRHLERLERHGFIIRHDDVCDQRRSFVELVPDRKEPLLDLLAEWCREVIRSPGRRTPFRTAQIAPRRHETATGSPIHSAFLS